ncbi:MAG: ABC transporter ATP-binding protein [Verrucomicrobia bacterium]|nr:MAG: ABC transporter ATP-binding protein [Verrucomicrobiota bacterium]
MTAIKIENLKRHFGPIRAIDGLSCEIAQGSVCGFIGANGAGKTTTMRILATLDEPDSGRVEICGYDVMQNPNEVRRKVGWMPDQFGHYEHTTVLEYLDFYSRALGYKGKDRRQRIDEVMQFTDLVPLKDRFMNALSKGMNQRLGLGRALLGDPQVLIMDEPAAGLDPKARVEFKHLVRVLAQEGKTIFISSHILSELGEMCDVLLFIDQGKLVHHGNTDSLRRHTDQDAGVTYQVQLDGTDDALSQWCILQPDVRFMEARKSGGRILIQNDEPAKIAELLSRMIHSGLKVTEFQREERNLEDAFIDMIGMLDQKNASIPKAGSNKNS